MVDQQNLQATNINYKATSMAHHISEQSGAVRNSSPKFALLHTEHKFDTSPRGNMTDYASGKGLHFVPLKFGRFPQRQQHR